MLRAPEMLVNNTQPKVSPHSEADSHSRDSTGESVAPSQKTKPKILLLDDEERILKSLNAIFRFRYHVLTATEGNIALEILEREQPHLVISDQRMPKMSGVEFLRQAKVLSPNSVRLLLTGYSDLASIIGSINDGEIYRFICKPWSNQDIQTIVAEAAAIGVELQRESGSTVSVSTDVKDYGVIVLDDYEGSAQQIMESLGSAYTTYHAKDASDTLRILETRRVGVIVADLKAGNPEIEIFFRLLKGEYPQILTIVMDDYSDSARAIDLLNKTKIYRYLVKPVKSKMLQHYIGSAMEQFRTYRLRPTMLQQQTPEKFALDGQSAFGQGILRHLRSLKDRLLRLS
jgi:eukaryotic-like serine/threonine-protein kinase